MSKGGLELSALLSVQPVEGYHDEETSGGAGYAAGEEHIGVLASAVNQDSWGEKSHKSHIIERNSDPHFSAAFVSNN